MTTVAWLNATRDWTDINKEPKNGESSWIFQGCRHVGMDGLHADDVHLERKKKKNAQRR